MPGAFVYTPGEGTMLNEGTQSLGVNFTPTDTANYVTATASQTLMVRPPASTDWAQFDSLGNGGSGFTNGALGFTVSTGTGQDQAGQILTVANLSFMSDWSVQVNVHLDSLNLSGTQYADLSLIAVKTTDLGQPSNAPNMMSVAIDRHGNGAGTTVCDFQSNLTSYFGGVANNISSPETLNSATDGTLRISFNSITKMLTAAYAVDGSNWNTLQTVYIGGGEFSWGMAPGDTFSIGLLGSSGSNGGSGPVLAAGQAYFSNFLPVILAPIVTVTTLAGSGSAGSTDGTGTAASFNGLSGVAVDASGNVYVADTLNNKIREVSPAGVVTTLACDRNLYWPSAVALEPSGSVCVADLIDASILSVDLAGVVTTWAGSGSAGATDASGTAASFHDPRGVAVDASGNAYVADTTNNRIRKVSPAGVVTTLAGSGSAGSTDGTGTAASFNSPYGVAVDAAGNVFVADFFNNRIRMVDSTGVVTTLAGSGNYGASDGQGTAATFTWPAAVAVDALGDVYVADYGDREIRRIVLTQQSAPLITWTAPAAITYGAALSSAQLNATANVPGTLVYAPAAGTVLNAGTQILSVTFTPTDATDYTGAIANQTLIVNQAVPVITWTAPAEIAIGTPLSAAQLNATANVPGTFAYSPSAGTVLNPGTQSLSVTFTPTDDTDYSGATATQTLLVVPVPSAPTAGPAGDVIAGRFTAIWDPAAGATGYRLDVSTDSAFSTFVAGYQGLDVGNVTEANVTGLDPATTYYYRVEAYDASGIGISSSTITVTTSPTVVVAAPLTVSTLAGQALTYGTADGTGGGARFYFPSGAAADNAGNLYVADANNHTIRKIVTGTGTVTTLAGLAGNSGNADGTGSAARFDNPSGVAVDGAGNVFVADTMNNTLRKVTALGVVTTLAGTPGTSGSADGTGSNAQFQGPQGLVADLSGNLYVADTNNQIIRKVVPSTGEVTTIAGLAGNHGSADGTGNVARFNYPSGIAIDSAGNLYVADTENNTVRAITPAGLVSTLAGLAGNSGGADGIGSTATFDSPSAIAADLSGNVYVADTGNFTIRKLVPVTGSVSTLAGLAGTSGSADGIGSAARFFQPAGIATDNNGPLYVADTDNHTIRLGLLATAPSIQTQPQSQTVIAGSGVQFSVMASGRPAPAYQWYFDGAAISGAVASSYSLGSAQSADAGSYTVAVTNTLGSVTSSPATLTVNAVTPPPSNGGGGGGGGGGAPSLWFIFMLALGGVARWAERKPGFLIRKR